MVSRRSPLSLGDEYYTLAVATCAKERIELNGCGGVGSRNRRLDSAEGGM